MTRTIPYRKSAIIIIIALCTMFSSSAQSIDLERDQIPENQAKEGQREFRKKTMKGINHVTFNTDQLKEIVDKCDALGIDTIQFLICNFRKNDIPQYITQYEGKHRAKKNLKQLSSTENNDLVDRQYLVIKVPRRAFGNRGNSGKSALPGAMTSLLASGLIQVNPEGSDEAYVYLSVGRICPPPSDCEPHEN